MKLHRGFTIVELLIVIVVIAILAAISIVAYNGIQTRAKNTQVIAGVNTYLKAFQQYKTIHSAYPTTSGCLGASYPDDACWKAGSAASHSINPTLDTQLSEFLPTKPVLATSLLSIGVSNYSRAGLMYLPYDSTWPNRFVFYLSGTNQSCGITGFQAMNEGGVVTQCNMSLP